MPKLSLRPKMPAKPTPAQLRGLFKFWKNISGLAIEDIVQEAERPFTLALIGPPDHTALLAARLALESPVPYDGPEGPADIRPYISAYEDAREAPAGSLLLQADPLTADETRLAQTLARIVVGHPDLRLSLARHIPAFRPAVGAKLISDSAWQNARIALISALPGVVPLTDVLLPAAAVGDMVALTRNQVLLLLRLAAAYGLPVDLRARMQELLPIVGSAFGWRAVARELLGLVPGGVGAVVKASIACAGTYTVGKAAMVFYSTGRRLSRQRLGHLYRDAMRESAARIRGWLRRPQDMPDALAHAPVLAAEVPVLAAEVSAARPKEPAARVKKERARLVPVGRG